MNDISESYEQLTSKSALYRMLDHEDARPETKKNRGRYSLREAYVTERFFEETIKTKVFSDEEAIFGWFYYVSKKDCNRTWLKFVPNSPLESRCYKDLESDFKFSKAVLDSGNDQIYLIFISQDNSMTRLDYCRLLKDSNSNYFIRKSKVLANKNNAIEELLERSAQRFIFLSKLQQHEDPFCYEWLDGPNTTKYSLLSLLGKRVLINCFGDTKNLKEKYKFIEAHSIDFPVDVDMISFNGKQVFFTEFKRKNCARGFRNFDWNEDSLNDEVLERLHPFYKGKKPLDFLKLNHISDTYCYGLDKSHFYNFLYCDRSRGAFKYRYLIWHEEVKFPSVGNLFEKSNSGNLVPRKSVELKSLILESKDTPFCFCGVTTTRGSNSGAFTGNPRMQATILESKFKERYILTGNKDD